MKEFPQCESVGPSGKRCVFGAGHTVKIAAIVDEVFP